MTDSVTYFSLIEGSPPQHFRCERLLATLSRSDCAHMWRQANEQNSERRRLCRGCVIGASHAGKNDANLGALHGMKICARCQRPASRLIWGHLCVSCQNRQYEFERGYNARGKPLSKSAVLEPRQVNYLEGPARRTLRLALSLNVDELVLATLRDAAKRVAFGFIGPAQASNLRQLRLI